MPFETLENYSSGTNACTTSFLDPLTPKTTVLVNNDVVSSDYSTNFSPEGFPMLNQVEESNIEHSQPPLTNPEQSQPQKQVDELRFHKCPFCDQEFQTYVEFYRHQRSHGYTCFECGESFSSHWVLNDHAVKTDHESYHCTECDAKFSRLDVLKRHKIQHLPTAKKYSCKHCKKWRAPNGFTRKDHLTQHERNYHHIESTESSGQTAYSWGGIDELRFFTWCLHEGCPLFRPSNANGTYNSILVWNPLFPSRGAFTKHMRQEHDETPFPCTKAGCKRINGKGFFRKRDLMKHMKREHEISEEAEIATVDKDVAGETSLTFQ